MSSLPKNQEWEGRVTPEDVAAITAKLHARVATLETERDEMLDALAAYGIGKEDDDWYYTCEPHGEVDAPSLKEAIGEMAKLKDDDQLAVEAERDRLREAARRLAEAEANYRHAYDGAGDGSHEAGYAWDQMRKRGDEVRAALTGGGR